MEPDAVSAKVGSTVQFNPKDGNSHKVSYGKGDSYNNMHEHVEGVLKSGEIKPDDSYKVIFSKEGAYYFHDHTNTKAYVSILV